MYNEIEKLKKLNRSAKTQAERDAIDEQMQALCEKNPTEFETAFEKSLECSISEYKQNSMKEQLSEVSRFISLSYIARNYFNKSRMWLYQRINNYEVNGKPAVFSQKEVDTLNFAFADINRKIGSIKVSL